MKSEKLLLNKDFKRLYGRGSSFVHPILVTYVLKNRSGRIRFGITTGKKVGCAVLRNRARRVISSALRECMKSVDCEGADLVFVARSRTPSVKSTDIEAVMKGHLRKAGIIPEEKNEEGICVVD